MSGLDGWLRRRGVDHPLILPILRNELLLAVALLAIGTATFRETEWVFWLAAGQAMSAWIFWSLSRFFLRTELGDFSTAFLRAVLMRWGFRLLLSAVLVYAGVVMLKASPIALLAGVTLGLAVALATHAVVGRSRSQGSC